MVQVELAVRNLGSEFKLFVQGGLQVKALPEGTREGFRRLAYKYPLEIRGRDTWLSGHLKFRPMVRGQEFQECHLSAVIKKWF